MSAKFLELQEKAIEVLLNKVYTRARDELKNNNFSFAEPYKYFGIVCEHDTYVYDLLIKEGFDVHHNTDCKCDNTEDNCRCPLTGLHISLLPRNTKNVEVKSKPDVKPDKEKSLEKEPIAAKTIHDCTCDAPVEHPSGEPICDWCKGYSADLE
jgi:hypothetical protein